MFRSATLKLTAWYLAIVMTISLMFSGVLYHLAATELAHGIRRESARISDQFPVFQGSPMLGNTVDYSRSAHHILYQLVLFNVIVLVAAGLASYYLARLTLRPIEEAHHQQARFTADVSHELRTPLTALKMESEVALMDGHSSAKALRDTLRSNLEEVSKMETLINNLLRLTKLDAGQLEAGFAPVSGTAIVTGALKQVDQAISERGLAVRYSPAETPLYGDSISLTQVLVILLDNAIKYSPAGSTVELSSGTTGPTSWVTIRDHGQGIAKAALDHIFDRFYRADGARNKTASEGYGLGLSIAQQIIDLHHGTITITSRTGHGTTATITLPSKAPNKR